MFAAIVMAALAFVVMSPSPAPPQKAADRFLAGYRAMDLREVVRYSVVSIDGSGQISNPWQFADANQERLVKAVHKRVAFKTDEGRVEGDSAVVNVVVTGVSLAKLLDQTMTALNSTPPAAGNAASIEAAADKAMELLVSNVLSPQAPTTTTEVQLHLVKVREEWKVVFDETSAKAFTAALMGGTSLSATATGK
jgi:ribosomal protein L12E/L44/L45/RPP1/RPP2